ncbi:MAG: hypothetical protein EHM47_06690 [Ignavibacteriales bacterium]|nr:MAG: hypothetical protein EHM47_06690 [Ignavibacteriales bacterium]
MYKKIISALLLISFFNYLIGCYTVEKMSKEEVYNNTEKITEVVFPSGESVKFNKAGAKLVYVDGMISGRNEKGGKYQIPLEGIKELRIKTYPVKPDEVKPEEIKEVIAINSRSYVFDRNGAVFNEVNNSIKGKSREGKDLEIKLEGIDYVYVTEPDTISISGLIANYSVRVKQIVFFNNTVRNFDDSGGKYAEPKYVIKGMNTLNEQLQIDPEEILYINVEKMNYGNTCLATLGGIVLVGGIIVLIALATKESCPFIYSFDGEKYVFDAEPLGGATTKGLQREDYSCLENLKEVNGKYKLRITNEVAETQYINRMQLFTVDHPAGTEIIFNNDGEGFFVDNPASLIYATDENGNSLNKFLEKEDDVCWQNNMKDYLNLENFNTRQTLTFAFPKPESTDSAKLILDAGTTLWGSNMIKEMLMLYGNEVDNWYEKIDQKKIEYNHMMSFLQNEELYELKLYLKEKDGWNEKGIIQGGGPFITEKRIVELDVSNVEGDTLFLRVNPPVGFWSFDYMAVEYSNSNQPNISLCKMTSAIDYKSTDISEIINSENENYYLMPETGNYFDLEFEAPEISKGMARSVFAKTSGYYKIHLPKTDPPDYQFLYSLSMNPGKIVKYSVEKYKEWLNKNLTTK